MDQRCNVYPSEEDVDENTSEEKASLNLRAQKWDLKVDTCEIYLGQTFCWSGSGIVPKQPDLANFDWILQETFEERQFSTTGKVFALDIKNEGLRLNVGY